MATALQSSCEEQQSNNLDEYSDSDAESEKVRKTRQREVEWYFDMQPNTVIGECEARPCLWNIFCDDYHNRDVTGKAKKELEVSQSELHALLG